MTGAVKRTMGAIRIVVLMALVMAALADEKSHRVRGKERKDC